MTAVNLSTDLPSELVTLEKLTYHNILAMDTLYNNQEILLDDENKQYKRSQIQIAQALDGKFYAFCALAFELDETILKVNPDNKRPWMGAVDWGTTAIPVAFKQNSPT